MQRRESTIDDDAWRSAEPAGRESPVERRLMVAEDRQCLEEALESLSEPQRRVLLLRYYGDLEFSEIAAALECPLGTVLSHCHRGLAKLRTKLVDYVP